MWWAPFLKNIKLLERVLRGYYTRIRFLRLYDIVKSWLSLSWLRNFTRQKLTGMSQASSAWALVAYDLCDHLRIEIWFKWFYILLILFNVWDFGHTRVTVTHYTVSERVAWASLILNFKAKNENCRSAKLCVVRSRDYSHFHSLNSLAENRLYL